MRRGQLIALPGRFVSTPLHSPLTGRVAAVELRLHPNGKMLPAVVVATDPYDSQRLPDCEPVDAARLTAKEMVERVLLVLLLLVWRVLLLQFQVQD